MNESTKAIEVPPAIEQRIQALTEELARALGESVEVTRRTVEISILTGGIEHARRQIENVVESGRQEAG